MPTSKSKSTILSAIAGLRYSAERLTSGNAAHERGSLLMNIEILARAFASSGKEPSRGKYAATRRAAWDAYYMAFNGVLPDGIRAIYGKDPDVKRRRRSGRSC